MEAENQGDGMGDPTAEPIGATAVDTATAPPADGLRMGAPQVDRSPTGPGAPEPCPRCGQELSVIRINVDGNTLLMESCDGCDARRWQLAGERIDLQEALDQVGEHSGRRPRR